MAWFLVDDNLADHQKVIELIAQPDGFAALGLWTICGAWSRRLRTHGDVPRTVADAQARKSGQRSDASGLAAALIEANLWTETSDGYQYVDWSDVYTDERKKAESKKKDRERKRIERAAQKGLDKSRTVHGQSTDSPMDAGSSPSPIPSPDPPLCEGVSGTILEEVLEPVPVALVPDNSQADRRGTGKQESTRLLAALETALGSEYFKCGKGAQRAAPSQYLDGCKRADEHVRDGHFQSATQAVTALAAAAVAETLKPRGKPLGLALQQVEFAPSKSDVSKVLASRAAIGATYVPRGDE